jgi:pentapeptide repeat protein
MIDEKQTDVDDRGRDLGMTGSNWFVKVFWPIFASVVAAVFTFVSWTLNQRQQRSDSLNKAIESATAEGTQVKRIAGIWQMNQYWKEERFEDTLSATLTAALIGTKSDDGLYRCAAAEVIGNAIDGVEGYSTGTDATRSERIAHLLYGDSSGKLGLVSELNRELRGSQSLQDYKTCENYTDVTALDATREAIRKNWEYLRTINLDTTDLSGIRLYEADLDSTLLRAANLHSANLRCANLQAADLTQANLANADFYLANVANLKPDDVRSDLVNNKKAKEFKSGEWESWRRNDFRVSKQGQPVLSKDQNLTDDTFPCG